MGIIERNNATFDTTTKAKKVESITSFIFATSTSKNSLDIKTDIAENLRSSYKIFKHDAGSYMPNKSTFESHYTLGLEMGIWKNTKNFQLTDLARRVADLEITSREYLDIVFLNLFGYYEEIDGSFSYKHFLYETLVYLNENNLVDVENDKEVLGIPFASIFRHVEGYEDLDGKSEKTVNQQLNSLFNYLTDTDYFTAVSSRQFIVSKKWQDRVNELIEMCNLEYSEQPRSEVQKIFKGNQEKYADYLTKVPGNVEIVGGIALKDIKEEDEQSSVHHIDRYKQKGGKNKVYFGAPGTGKSYQVTKDIEKIYPTFNGTDSVESIYVIRTTLHPEYTYNDFVGQLLPDIEGNDIKYTFQTGIFTDALKRSIEMPNNQIFLVLEEMSRANVAAVFGDLFQLLDRDENGDSQYAINNSLIANSVYGNKNKQIRIPSNLTILATVNTNDQNVFVMDTAFKRRFEWEYISTKPIENINNRNILIYSRDGKALNIKWNNFYQLLNEFITEDMQLSEDKQLGQFFIKFSSNESEELREKNDQEQLKNKLLQYLWEDIQAVSYDQRLFQDSITSFGDCYERFDKGKNVFSDKFIAKVQESVESIKSGEISGETESK
ncbi:AAA family ATPase [Latilactobacillus sakei]|uniref:AAA family ATPase n=1 Tax=Latilactobacillus sakei TaxID=1599 RepID=UPI001F206FD7|nr:AAA family ATPase [Latilactobacillus sakei]